MHHLGEIDCSIKPKIADDYDKRILDAIFNPSQQNLFSELLDTDSSDIVSNINNLCNNECMNDSRWISMQLEAIRMSESGDHESASRLLTDCIAMFPNVPELYNDRCQVYRSMKKYNLAWDDIQKSINLATKEYESRNIISKILGQAYMQRAILRKFHNIEISCSEQQLSDAMQSDFESSAKYGNRIASYYAVKNNQYAALCNIMLQRAIKEEYNIADSQSLDQ